MKKVNEDLADLAMRAESDHEVQMARAELYKIAKYAIKLHDMLKGVSEREGLDGWVQSKITKSADYIGSVYHHLDYEMKFESVQLGEADKKGTVTSVKDVKAPVAKPKKNGTVNKVSDARMTAKKKPGLAKDKYKESIEDKLNQAVAKFEARYNDGGIGVVEKLLQGLTKDFVMGDDKAAQQMVDMLNRYNAPLNKVADMLEFKANQLTKNTFSIFDNPLKKTPAGDAADRMTTLADYIRSKARGQEERTRSESVKHEVSEKAKSKAQQKFMGMVHAAKKGEKPASKEVAKAAKGMSKKDAKDYASTKHKGLPNKVAKKD